MDFASISEMFTSLPMDVVAAALFATAITVDTLRAGASRAIALSLALVIAPTLYAIVPNTYLIGSVISGISIGYMDAIVFAALVVLLAFTIYRITTTFSDDSARPGLAIVTGIATTVVVLCVWHMSPVLQALWTFSPAIQAAFGEAYRLYWLLLAFIAFAFVKG